MTDLLYLSGSITRAITIFLTFVALTILVTQYVEIQRLNHRVSVLERQLDVCSGERALMESSNKQLRFNLSRLDQYYRESKPFCLTGRDLRISDMFKVKPK